MGSIYQRKDSPYLWMKWRDAAGKLHQEATRFRRDDPSQVKEAARALELLERQLAAERRAGEGVLTVRGFADSWLTSLRLRKVATVKQTAQRLRDFVHPLLGELPLREVRPHHLAELLEVLGAEHELAPRTRRGVYGILHAMFQRALRQELVAGNPCALEKHELPPNVDADPAWRATAIYTRGELEQLLSDERVRADRRILNALLFLGGMRIGEALARRWTDYDAAAEPLGRLEVPTSWSTVRAEVSPTKTKVARQVPVHPLLAQVLAEWRLRGWAAFMGRPPRDENLIIPGRDGEHRNAQVALERHYSDLDRLGLRRRRLHDARRTFISLAQADGAPPHLLKWVTHGQRSSVMDQYTTPPWTELCGAVAKLRIRRLGAREVTALSRAAGAELRSATSAGTSSPDAPLEAIRSTTSPSRRVRAVAESARSPGGSPVDGCESSPEQPAQRSRPATLTIELRLTEAQHTLAQRDPTTLGARRWEAEHLIQAEQKRWGYDWQEIECRLLAPDGALVEVVRFEPLVRRPTSRDAGHVAGDFTSNFCAPRRGVTGTSTPCAVNPGSDERGSRQAATRGNRPVEERGGEAAPSLRRAENPFPRSQGANDEATRPEDAGGGGDAAGPEVQGRSPGPRTAGPSQSSAPGRPRARTRSGELKTCDRPICAACAVQLRNLDQDFCPTCARLAAPPGCLLANLGPAPAGAPVHCLGALTKTHLCVRHAVLLDHWMAFAGGAEVYARAQLNREQKREEHRRWLRTTPAADLVRVLVARRAPTESEPSDGPSSSEDGP